MINLNKLYKHKPNEHFKMEGLFLLKEVLQKVDYMCKTNLNEAYFQFPFTHNLKNL